MESRGLVFFKGVETIGVSISSSILATIPICSLPLAVLFLNEYPIIENWIGTMLIIIGVIWIEQNLSKPISESKRTSKTYLIFPLLSALSISFSALVKKYWLHIYNEHYWEIQLGTPQLCFSFYAC